MFIRQFAYTHNWQFVQFCRGGTDGEPVVPCKIKYAPGGLAPFCILGETVRREDSLLGQENSAPSRPYAKFDETIMGV